MKLGIFSDLHLEFREREWFYLTDKINEQASACEILINAGDTHPQANVRSWFEGRIIKPIVAVQGNHDFYGNRLRNAFVAIENQTQPSIWGCTLWTDFNNHDTMLLAQFNRVMSDGRLIETEDPSKLVAESILDIHEHNVEWLRTNVQPGDVVITHHAPSLQSIHEKYYHTGQFNYYFASDLDQLILELKPSLWVHGHMHDSFDYTIGDTRVVCNPLGYPHERDAQDYNLQFIEVPDAVH